MYKFHQKISYETTLELLNYFKGDFTPRLDSEVDIYQYAAKLSQNAYFALYEENGIKGYIAYYLNVDAHLCFITSVAVERQYRGTGVANKLLHSLLEQLPPQILCVKLEVSRCVESALNLYKKNGFVIESENEQKYQMCKKIQR